MNIISRLLSDLTARVLGEYYAIKFSPGQSLPEAQAEYRAELVRIMAEYMDSTRPITAFRNEYRRMTNDAYNVVFVAGWADGGASGPLPDHLRAWLNGEIDKQVVFIDGVFEELKALRKEGDQAARSTFIMARANGYTASLIGVYAYAKMQAAKYKMGIWRLGPTEEHCQTCAGLDGQVRTLAWFLEQGLIPQQSGSATLECGGWNCQCGIYDVVTGQRLIP